MDAHDQRPKLTRSLSSPDSKDVQLPPAVEAQKVLSEAHPVPPRPPRNPARSSISPSTKKKRPSTATGTREDVTPWEFYPAPEVGKPNALLKPWPEPSSTKQDTRLAGNATSPSSSSHTMSIASFILRRRKSSGNKDSDSKRGKLRSNTIPQPVPPPPPIAPFENATAGPSNLSQVPRASSSDPHHHHNHDTKHSRLISATPMKQSISASPSYPSSSPSSQLLPTSAMATKSHPELPSTRAQQSPTRARDAQFSTADRTILKELKRNIDAKEAQFVVKGVPNTGSGSSWAAGRGRHHPYSMSEVPYPRNYDREVLDFDVWETVFCQQLCGSVTWHIFEAPPTRVLDIGCGAGSWVLDCAMKWKECQFVGLDVVPLHPNLQQLGSVGLAGRITWVQANFLEGLPFPNEEFDYVHVKRIARGVPEDKWDFLLEEITRVMKPGAAFEMMEEDLFFPGKPVDDGANDSEDEEGSQYRANTILSWQTSDLDGQDIVYEDDRSSQETGSGSPSVLRDDASSNAHSTPRTSSVALPAQIKGLSPIPDNEDISMSRGETPIQARKSLPQLHVQTNTDPERLPTRALSHDFTDSGISLRNTMSSSSLISSTSPRTKLSSNHSKKHLPSLSPTSPSSTKSPDRDSVYHPFLLRTLPKPPANPRDHGLLELIYNEMHAARFINLSPLSLLANSLGLYFRDVRTHPPLQWTFPPRPVKRGRQSTKSVVSTQFMESDSSSGDEAISRRPFKPRQASPQEVRAPQRRRAATLGSQPQPASIAVDSERVTTKSLINGESKFISLDESQFSAYSPSSRASFPSPVRGGHKDSFSSGQRRKPPSSTAKSASMSASTVQSRLPNKTLNLDLKSLNLHLALRVSEVLACTEAMWEWVRDYQGQVPKPRLLSSLHGSADVYESALSDLTREDFDSLLARFNTDMREQIAIGDVMEDRYGWTSLPTAPTYDRKVFDAAWQKWCQWERQQNPIRPGYTRFSNTSDSIMSRSTAAQSSVASNSGPERRISQSSVEQAGAAVRRSGSLTHSGHPNNPTDHPHIDKRRFSHYDDGLGGLRRSGSLLHELKHAKEMQNQRGHQRQVQHVSDQNSYYEHDSGQPSDDRYQFIPRPESRLSRVTRVFVAWKP